jgi:transcriptional regulator with PAS, ATPase and Fis domain
MPPLRERVDDIPLLVEYLIDRYAQAAGKKIKKEIAESIVFLSSDRASFITGRRSRARNLS